MKIRVIVNPKAGAGAAGKKVPRVRGALAKSGAEFEVVETAGPGDATQLARRAARDGVDVIAVVGGDGTLNEVAQAYVDDAGAAVQGPEVAVIPAGTGGDFRRTVGLGRDPEAAVRRLLEAEPRPVDLGLLDVGAGSAQPTRRVFVNIASFGVSGRIDHIVNRSPKWMGGQAAFAIGSLRAMSTYRNAPVSVKVDGKPWYEGRVFVTAIANGRYFGGGMQIAPDADPSDGLFDVVVLGDMSFAETLTVAPRIYRGKHLGAPRVHTTRGTLVEATPLDGNPVYIDADGETPGHLPLSARLLRGALRLRA